MDFSNIKITPTSDKLLDSGAELDYMGVKIFVARANNDKYKSAFKRVTRPFKKQIEKGNLPDNISEDIIITSIAEGLVVGWSNFKLNGKDVPFTIENCKNLLVNDPDCKEAILEFSEDINNYIVEEEEEIVKE